MLSYKTRFFTLLAVALLCLIAACTPYKLIEKIPAGTHRKRMLFRSEPTPADIFINEKYLGRTPIVTDIWYIGERSLNVKAQPLYPSQYPQNIVVKVPRVPNKMTIFMDYNPMVAFELKEKKGGIGAAGAGEDDPYAVTEFSAASLKDTIIIKEPIPLPVIYFDFDKHYIPEKELDKLYPIVELLLKNPDYLISIHGHADERGTVGYNKVLSTNRALAVYEYMLDSDIAPERMRIYGHGELTIIEREGYRLEYQNDRVVTFRLYDKKFEEPSPDD
ncbi:MAG: OmpA family protein [Candidatus Cloacimonetes bacterium]|nr:OmpA family protein [Candidatus Cloacimonadota bacterium]